MTEDFVHYIWKFGLYESSGLRTICGKEIRVINPGRHNHDAGPDFLEAKLQIDKVLWIGHVEIHIKASDWIAHKHQHDPLYDPVVLHVVLKANHQAKNSRGIPVPTIELKFNQSFYRNYQELNARLSPIPCGLKWREISPVKIENAITAMGVERMQQRMEGMQGLLDQNKGSLREMFFQFISRGFGFGKNQASMEQLARSISTVWLERHYANLFQLESILFGQAGFIPARSSDPYVAAIRSEYKYLKSKYNMIRAAGLDWKFLRMRPGNFPTVRIAQLASFLHQKKNITDSTLEIAAGCDPEKIELITSSYWRVHYDMGKKAKSEIPVLGESSKLLLMINVFQPLLAFHRSYRGDTEALEFWLEQLENLPPENNRIMNNWKDVGFRIPNAFYSQSFFYIYRNYCVNRKCLNCKIGHLILGINK